MTGFRVALGGAQAIYAVKPDLTTLGKVIGGGMPVGALGGRADIMDYLAPLGPVYQAGTLSANPVAMAAGLAMLTKIKRDQPYTQLENKTESLSVELEKLFKKYSKPLSVQRFSSLFWCVTSNPKEKIIRAITDIPESQKSNYAKMFHQLLDRGIYLAPSGFEVSFLSAAHSDSDLDFFLSTFEETLK